MTRDDPLFRAAGQIHRRLNRYTLCQVDAYLCAAGRLMDVQLLTGLAWRRIEKARRHGWHLAAHALRAELSTAVRSLQAEVGRFLAVGDIQARETPPPPTLRSIVEELAQLRAEFEHVEIRAKQRSDGAAARATAAGMVVVARTEAIELEGVALGPFAIGLHVTRLDSRVDSDCFNCVALDPNPASANEEVTHPHVQSNSLCAGDASAAITQALRQGRINDAFCLVRSVLQTYNPHSPYVALDAWSGSPCPDCGRSVGSESLYYCEACGNDYCDDCIGSCDLCDQSACSGCLERDPMSGQRCCPGCRHTCDHCHRVVDADSFDEATGLCPECAPEPDEQEQQKEDDDNDVTDPQLQPLISENNDHEQPQPGSEPQPDAEPDPQPTPMPIALPFEPAPA
ncbi:MAG: hypothetical protein JWN40_1217 [Phycisphaerales bacterium]|nr:hypothetical protein [Phycisphaerales bacterium]